MTTTYISLNGLENEEALAEIRKKAAEGSLEWQILLAEYDIHHGVDVEKNLAFLEALHAKKNPETTNRLAYLYGSGGAFYDEGNAEECEKKQLTLMEEAAEYGSENACIWFVNHYALKTESGTMKTATPDDLAQGKKWAEKAVSLGLQDAESYFCKPGEFIENILKNPRYKARGSN